MAKAKEWGNVLVIGNSGVGKSTLINAVLGSEEAQAGIGTEGTTKHIRIYPEPGTEKEYAGLSFRLIDTPGFEPSLLKQMQTIREVRKWSEDSAEHHAENRIHVIWFCVDGTSGKLFPDAIRNLSQATRLWKSIPVIVVITKSYSVPERQQNIDLVHNAFAKQRSASSNLKAVIPVVAKNYVINDSAYAAPDGIPELIAKTNELLPEGRRAASTDVAAYQLQRRRILSQTVVGTATAAAVTIGAVPIPFADAALLTPIEVAEVNAIAQIYGVSTKDKGRNFINSIIQVGTVSAAAKFAISAARAIPGVGIAVTVLDAVIAGSFAAAIGEGSIYAFEQVYLGQKSLDDIEWVTKLMENQFSANFSGKVEEVLKEVAKAKDLSKIPDIIRKVFYNKK